MYAVSIVANLYEQLLLLLSSSSLSTAFLFIWMIAYICLLQL